jgi:hypothetical protein
MGKSMPPLVGHPSGHPMAQKWPARVGMGWDGIQKEPRWESYYGALSMTAREVCAA